ncbi:MAG: isoprenyl transferase [Actinomycetota bacterium]
MKKTTGLRADGSGEDLFLGKIDRARVPAHVAIIMDGNGRWAKKRALPRIAGHRAGVKSVKRALEAARNLGVDYLTLYAFSLENWRRPEDEVSGLMKLLVETIKGELKELNDQGIRLKALGRWRELPPEIVAEIEKSLDLTAGNTKGNLVLAVNYGGRAEIVDAAKRLAAEASSGAINPEDIDEDVFAARLYDPEIPDPDLFIRTSGEMRVSNFLLWEIAYTEMWVTPVLWPDFDKRDFYEAVYEYQKRSRRFGGLDPEAG